MSRSLLFICAIALLTGFAKADSFNIEAGPIWGQIDANRKCPAVAARAKGTWTGHWWTTQPGKMSVCQISLGSKALPPVAASATSHTKAMATASLNVRIGPGVGYAKIGALGMHEVVSVSQCTSANWCAVSFRGRTGWVSRRYLVMTPSQQIVRPQAVPAPVIVVEPPEPDIIVLEPDEPEIIVIEHDDPDVILIEDDDEIILLD